MALRRSRITPFLWYDGQAEEAARYYVSVFKNNSRVTSVSPMSVTFTLDGRPFMALNGGPIYRFNEAVSLFVDCRDQKEVDYYWKALGKGGRPGRCGWLKDRWGLSWQVVPRALGACLSGRDKAGAQRAMAAMLEMGKLDVAKLEKAYRRQSASRKG
jgi:predicted 3-demethylubiquinone-9 3-methyltransferase (glyoxalase superfamily)